MRHLCAFVVEMRYPAGARSSFRWVRRAWSRGTGPFMDAETFPFRIPESTLPNMEVDDCECRRWAVPLLCLPHTLRTARGIAGIVADSALATFLRPSAAAAAACASSRACHPLTCRPAGEHAHAQCQRRSRYPIKSPIGTCSWELFQSCWQHRVAGRKRCACATHAM